MDDLQKYRKIVGKVNYLAVTCPDIIFPISVVSLLCKPKHMYIKDMPYRVSCMTLFNVIFCFSFIVSKPSILTTYQQFPKPVTQPAHYNYYSSPIPFKTLELYLNFPLYQKPSQQASKSSRSQRNSFSIQYQLQQQTTYILILITYMHLQNHIRPSPVAISKLKQPPQPHPPSSSPQNKYPSH